MENKVGINNNSVDSAGITKEYKEAIAELIWNGFDAKATRVDLIFNANELDHIDDLVIADNGTGIDLSTLGETFGSFLDSLKRKSVQKTSSVRGKKGKGRFSFIAFAETAVWQTVYKDQQSGKFLEYDITIQAGNKHVYKNENNRISPEEKTGTSLRLSNLHGIMGYSLSSTEFMDYLKAEFGWFLLLNEQRHFCLSLNGVAIEFRDIIAEDEVFKSVVSDHGGNEFEFKITYVRWKKKIGDKFYYYFLNEHKKELYKELTSFNHNAINFYHSMYVESSFFNEFISSDKEDSGRLFGVNRNNLVFKRLLKELRNIINTRQKAFVRINAADELISKYERLGVFPKFRNNKYEQEKKKDLVEVVREIYCIQPKIFKGLSETQEKTSVGFINLLLDTDERGHILNILDGIVQITAEERENLSNLLKKTSFSHILRTINLIESRAKTIELLKTLVFDLKSFTNERDHIQHAIAENYWLFGEQFHLVTANEAFEKVLSKYLYIIDDLPAPAKVKLQDAEKVRRPDLFICRQRSVPDPSSHDDDLEENIMVELKRPDVVIGKAQLRQIEDYMDFVTRQPEFNAQTRQWKFFVISNETDAYIKKQYDEFRDKGKRFLVKSWGNLEIFAMTWDDVFRSFAVKHKYLLDKLDFDKRAIAAELKAKGIDLNVDSSATVTKEVRAAAVTNF
jgi:hypothetical protein